MLSKRVEHDLWARQMDELLASWREAHSGSEPNFLRALFEFVETAPHRDFIQGLALPPGKRFNSLIELGAFQCAVLEWLADESSFMISRSPDGLHIATVVLAGQGIEGTAKARTGGLALAGAILLSLAEANA